MKHKTLNQVQSGLVFAATHVLLLWKSSSSKQVSGFAIRVTDPAGSEHSAGAR